MTTLIFIENVLGSGEVVNVCEDFGDYSVARDVLPGEHARLVISPFKTLSVEEVPLSLPATPAAANAGHSIRTFPAPRTLERRCG